MLKGIDISNHQGYMDLSLMHIDFVIAKATEGVTFVDWWCDTYIQQAVKLGIPFGFYHYARDNEPEEEAQYFIDNCVGYLGIGIPVLDWEEDQSVDWVNRWVRYYHEKTEVWPWIYANPWRFNQGGVEENCGRWIAAYPQRVDNPTLDHDPGSAPYTDGLICAWQYASDGRVSGYDGNLDLDHFYGDENAWKAYSKGNNTDIENIDPPVSEEDNETETFENNRYVVTVTRKKGF